MTSEAHVTISAAQQGGMHPFVHLASPLFTRVRVSRGKEDGEKDSQDRERGRNIIYCEVWE